MPRRERWEILGAILVGVEREQALGAQARAADLAAHTDLPFDQLQHHLDELEAAGILAGDPPALTPKGEMLLAEFRRWSRVLAESGLAEHDA